MKKITHIFVGCHRGDQILARICVGSIRYWYPEIPIYLVKDEGSGPFSTEEMERHWKVSVLSVDGYRAKAHMNKIRMFFGRLSGRALFIDADIVLLGRVLEAIEAHDEDVVIAGENTADLKSADISAWYYDWDQLQRFDPGFRYPAFCFNTGQFAWTLGVINRECFTGVLDDGEEVRLTRPDIFRCGDQGVLNYVVQKKHQEGRLRVGRLDFARWIHDPSNPHYRVDEISRRVSHPMLLHWAGVKPFSLSRMPRADILQFYEDHYYSRIPLARWKRILRAVVANGVGTYGAFRKWVHRWRVRLLPNRS